MNLDDRTSNGENRSDSELIEGLGGDTSANIPSASLPPDTPGDPEDYKSAPQQSAEAEAKTMTPPKGKGKGPQSFATGSEPKQNGEASIAATKTASQKSSTASQTAKSGSVKPAVKTKPETVLASADVSLTAETGPIATFDLNAYVAPTDSTGIDEPGEPTVKVAKAVSRRDPALSENETVADPDLFPPSQSGVADVSAEVPSMPPIHVDVGSNGSVQPSSAKARPATKWLDELLERVPDAVPSGLFQRSRRVQARKVRRIIRHVDPWSVLTFSVLFHLFVFASILLASVLVWNAAEAAGTIENMENFIQELGDYKTYNIDEGVVFRAAMLIAGILTLASSVLVVLLAVVFNLISDLIGGIRVTVVEEEVVRMKRNQNSVASSPQTR